MRSGKERPEELHRLFQRADHEWGAGNLRSAYRLFLACAKAGDCGCQVNLGNFYADGIGVKRNRERAIYWYRRAYQRRDAAAANNIGILYRDEGNLKRALVWFERAVQLGDADANLEIAKICIQKADRAKAIAHLKSACHADSRSVTDASRQEAKRLLRKVLDEG